MQLCGRNFEMAFLRAPSKTKFYRQRFGCTHRDKERRFRNSRGGGRGELEARSSQWHASRRILASPVNGG